MTAVQVSPRISCRDLDLSDPELGSWVATMQSRLPRAVRELTSQKWLGLYFDDQLFAAMSFTHRKDGSIFIDGLVCRPNKLGRKYAVALWMTLRTLWRGRRISFCVALSNHKMLRALTQYTTAKPVAAVFEMEV